MKCIILCAGYATRLYPLTKNTPKHLLKINDRTILDYVIEKIPMAEQLRFVIEKNGSIQIYLPWQMLFYLTIGAFVGIIVSLLSKSIRQDKLDRFYELVRTPVITGEAPSPIPCTIPNNVIIPPKRKLLPFKNLEILVPNWTSAIGFVVSWGLVGLLIYVFFIIVK